MSTIPSKRWWKKQGDLTADVGDHADIPFRFRPVVFVVGQGDVEPFELLSSMLSRAVRKPDIDMAMGAVGGPADRDTKAFNIVCVGILGTSVDLLLCPRKLLGNLNDRDGGFCVVCDDLDMFVPVGLTTSAFVGMVVEVGADGVDSALWSRGSS